MTEPLAVFTTLRGLVASVRARRIQLGYSQLEVDHRSGLPSGYTGKLEAILTNPDAKNARAFGWQSLPLVLGALGLSMTIMPSASRHDGENPRIALYEKHLARAGKGGKSTFLRMSSAEMARFQKKAAKARWGKERVSRSKAARLHRARNEAYRKRQKAKKALEAIGRQIETAIVADLNSSLARIVGVTA